MAPLEYHQGDERPYWQATVLIDGIADDLTSGHTFTVSISPNSSDAIPTVVKTAGISGAAGGVVTVAWATGELDITPGLYIAELTTTRNSDSKDWTISETLQIKHRLKT